MTPSELENWIVNTYPGIVVIDAYRERSFFYNPSGLLPKGVYLSTIKESDGPNDKASVLNRDGIYRISFGVGKRAYEKLFGITPKRPPKGDVIQLDFDFTALRVLMPHPIYAWMGWVAMNSPSKDQLETIQTFLDIAYQNVLQKFSKRNK